MIALIFVKNFKNILVYRIGHLGDTLVSLPTFWAIRKSFPNAQLTLLTNANSKNPNHVLARDILPENGLFDHWLTYPSETEKFQTLLAVGKLFLKLKQRKFDAVIYLTTRNRTVEQIKRDVLFFRLAGIKNIIGTKYSLQNLLDPNVLRPLPVIESEKDFLLKCFFAETETNYKPYDFLPDLKLTAEEILISKKWLEANCGKYLHNNQLLAVAPSGKWESKIWFENSFAEVVEKLIELENVFPIIFGGLEDREKGNRLIKTWGRGANAAGELNIRQAAGALAECRIYLGNDTGTMHLAAAVGTPCVAIFSAIDWAGRWTPFGDKNKILREVVPCEGCLSSICKFDNQCLTAIKAEQVITESLNLWNDEARIDADF